MNYLYVSQSGDGWRNLAADEYFLEHLNPEDMLLHVYVNRSAVIIGRGQNPWAECRLDAMERDGVQLVRRISGGGAVFHDEGNLNFSFITGETAYDVPRQLGVIASALRSLGIACEFSGRNDLLSGGRKFSGNAFCKRKGVCQHHGTLLVHADLARLQHYLNVDPRKLQSKGVKSVRSRVCNLSEIIPGLSCEAVLEALKEAFAAEYGGYAQLPEPDAEAVAPYIQKQTSAQWRLGETPRFDVEIENRFAWGNVQLLLTLRKGRVADVRAFTDALDENLSDEIAARLAGAEYGSETIAAALETSEKQPLKELAAFVRAQSI